VILERIGAQCENNFLYVMYISLRSSQGGVKGPVRFAFFPNEKSSSRSRRKTNQNEQGVTSTLARITSTLAIKLKYVIKKHLIQCYINFMLYLHNVKMHVLNIF
jgi:hypothetical protein